MIGIQRRLLLVSAATVGVMSALSTHAIAQAPPRSIGNNESVFIDGKALTITQGTAKDDVASKIAGLGARDLGPGAIIFRSGDKLYIVDPSLPLLALNDDRQRSYGGLNDDRQRSYGLNDDRQRSYGLNDDRQRSYGLNDDRQRSYGLTDAEIERQRVYMMDPDYAYYRLKKSFDEAWGASPKTESK